MKLYEYMRGVHSPEDRKILEHFGRILELTTVAGRPEAAQLARIEAQRHADNDFSAVAAWAFEALEHVAVQRFLAQSSINPASTFSALFAWTYAGAVLHARIGAPHFSLASDFFHAMALTDFGAPTDEQLQMPFDSFTFSFPPTPRFQRASRLWIHRVGSTLDEIQWRAALLLPDGSVEGVPWPKGLTRRQFLEYEVHFGRPLSSSDSYEVDPKRIKDIRTLILNVLTYIEASGPLPTTRPQKNAAPRPVERERGDKPIFNVGRPIKLDGRLRQALTASDGDVPKWQLAQRYMVRGHWRDQIHGPRDEVHTYVGGRCSFPGCERSRMFIEPYWKGPENIIEALNRTYEVVDVKPPDEES